MRLRYLHLPQCGPLTDAAVVFGRENLIAKTLNISRKGSLNFVVGVNGTGKSSLLRALYRIFRSLNRRELPELPVTIAWDRTIGNETKTILLHYTNKKDSQSFSMLFERFPTSAQLQDWRSITSLFSESKDKDCPSLKDFGLVGFSIDEAITDMVSPLLPKRLIAYTSGAVDFWTQIDHPVLHQKNEEEGQYQPVDERPQGWSMDRELEETQPTRMANVLNRYLNYDVSTQEYLNYSLGYNEQPSDIIQRIQHELGPLDDMRQKVLTNHMLLKEPMNDSYFRIDPRHLRFAGIILAFWQTVKELSGCAEEIQREVLRETLRHQRGSDDKPQDARRVLNELDWFWPTHLSLTYRDADDRVSPQQHQELLCLVALADEVIAQPLERQRVVISLGPSDRISLTEKLKDGAFPYGIPSMAIEDIAKRVDNCKTGAEAILRVFSADQNIDSTPMDVFSRLRDWERTGLLEDITLTVKRISQSESDEGEREDIIVTYDQLSDGEQMFLGRMGLLFLLRGQDGSLLLLDEPETHFNDVWKREIVEMVGMGLLNSTAANVIISTHTSIALTDAFAAEVTVLDKNRESGVTTARGVKGGLFGTDPGEVNMNLFRADSSIGSRSVELLNKLLKTEWKGRETELEAILDVLGSSFHRAELRAILKQLRGNKDGAASS